MRGTGLIKRFVILVVLFLGLPLPSFAAEKAPSSHGSSKTSQTDADRFSPDKLGYRESDSNLSMPGQAELIIPQDRCKPGILRFQAYDVDNPKLRKTYECPVITRGATEYADRPVGATDESISTPDKSDPTYWKCGQLPNGAPCCYVNEMYTNGAFPAAEHGYSLWLDGSRKNITSYGANPIACLDFNDSTENYKSDTNKTGRSELRIHSGRETTTFIDRSAHGCLRVDPSCQIFLNQKLKAKTGQKPDCSKKPDTAIQLTVEVK